MADDSVITFTSGGGMSFVGADATALYRANMLKVSLELYKKTGMIPTRGMTITKMMKMAKGITKKTYKRGQIDIAIQDVKEWCDAMKAAMPIVDERK
jgi:hypothetical protein